MNTETHRQLAGLIWQICNLLRGPYKRNEYRKVILPLTVLRRFDCLLAPTKAQALATFHEFKGKPESIIRSKMQAATGYEFYNLSKLEFAPSKKGRNSLLDDPSNLAPNLNSYINGFSPNVRAIMERFAFDQQIAKMAEKNLLFKVVQAFAGFSRILRVPEGGQNRGRWAPVRPFSALCSLEISANSFAVAHAHRLARQRLVRVSAS
jgi:type I restriction enzyme M protein